MTTTQVIVPTILINPASESELRGTENDNRPAGNPGLNVYYPLQLAKSGFSRASSLCVKM